MVNANTYVQLPLGSLGRMSNWNRAYCCDLLSEELTVEGLNYFACAVSIVCNGVSKGNKPLPVSC